jgi:protein-tyrosine phosphatase
MPLGSFVPPVKGVVIAFGVASARRWNGQHLIEEDTNVNVRTSQSDSLQIDPVTCALGEIGMTFCPGKKGDSVYGAAWDRDLIGDLSVVRDWGASVLVTLMEKHELDMLKVPELGEQAEAMGLEWHHLPIVDINVPDARFETLWTYSGHVLRRKLMAGEKIVIHCRGGLGRTGTIAAKLLIEFGMAPDEAMKQVRAARPGAIEGDLQPRYVLQQKPLLLDHGYADRVLGCLLGGAVGDAFGYAIEFDDWDQIQKRHGAAGLLEPVHR